MIKRKKADPIIHRFKTDSMENSLNYKGYVGSVQYSAEDEVFHGKIIGINDLVTFEGESVRELKAAFREAVDDYLETCAVLGKQPEKTYKGSFNVRIPTDLHRDAAFIATRENISLNDFVKVALSYAVHHPNEVKKELRRLYAS